MAGMDEAIIAGGVQSMTNTPLTKKRTVGTQDWVDWMSPSHPDSPEAPSRDMSITVGWNTAQIADISREEMDAWALRSHENAIAAIDEGRFAKEIVPIKVTTSDGSNVLFEVDEHPRRGSTLEKLASLKVLHPEIPGFSITAGNSSGMNDAAAALTLTSDGFAASHDLTPLATVRSWASIGVTPYENGIAPTIAIPKALARAGLDINDVASVGDQRGVRQCADRSLQDPGHRPGPRQHLGEWLQPRPPDRCQRSPHGHHPHLRPPASRWRHRCRHHVRRWRHGRRTGDRGTFRLSLSAPLAPPSVPGIARNPPGGEAKGSTIGVGRVSDDRRVVAVQHADAGVGQV